MRIRSTLTIFVLLLSSNAKSEGQTGLLCWSGTEEFNTGMEWNITLNENEGTAFLKPTEGGEVLEMEAIYTPTEVRIKSKVTEYRINRTKLNGKMIVTALDNSELSIHCKILSGVF